MKITGWLSSTIIPFLICIIVAYGCLKKKSVFDYFIKGAEKGLHTSVKLIPVLVGMMTAVGAFRSSGLLERLIKIFEKIPVFAGFPTEVLPILAVRLFSSGAATGLTLDLFRQYGPDSEIGWMASLFLSCTETVFYIMSIYFGTIGITKGRYTLKGAMISTAAGIIASILLVTYL